MKPRGMSNPPREAPPRELKSRAELATAKKIQNPAQRLLITLREKIHPSRSGFPLPGGGSSLFVLFVFVHGSLSGLFSSLHMR